ncbi:MAG: efflux RND transporter periplasmic adaptor subunit [Acidobacteria bacterium]|nr:efflux RND transporter periplasmic adaptor subunit [Acidobacteriota bacterium]MBI3473434.1 efflux RND transporter periplasmic adaptor subunit [Candidatus Solibacter usitatus]
MKKLFTRVLLVLVLGGGVYASYKYFQQLPQKQLAVATTKVRKGDVVVRAYARGELRAVRSVTLTAPNLFSTVQVTKLAPLGSLAKDKDLIVEFDDSERRSQLEETLLEVEQIDEQTKKSQADLSMRENQDQVELLKARYSVRRAELEVKRNELLAEIDAKKNILNLEESRRRLQQLESDIKSRRDQAQAELAVLREKRNKSLIDVARERQRIAQCKVLAPITGLVAIKQNRGGMMMFGQQAPDIREGDTVQPGTQVADVLDLSELEVAAKVGELDRANLREGQDVNIQLDAVPEKIFHGKIKAMSGTATSNPFGGDPGKKFEVVFSVDMKELMGGLGATPEQIRRVMETAERNAKKAPATSAFPAGMMMSGMPGGFPGGAMPGGAVIMQGGGGMPGGMQGGGMPGGAMPGAMAGGGFPGGGGMPGGQQGGAGGGRQGGGAGMSDEQRRAMFQSMLDRLPEPVKKELQKMIGKKSIGDLSNEERQKVFAKMRELMGGGQGGSGGPGGPGGGIGFRAPGGGRQGGAGGPNAAVAEDPRKEPPMTQDDKDRANAKLPLPPEEDSQLDILLRPGLLADVQIIVEKVSDAIHIPNQAVFEKDGKTFVYVHNGARFEERFIKPAKRSESVLIVGEGLKPGEVIALSDPLKKKETDKKDQKTAAPGKGMGATPGGGTGGGGRPK